MSANRFVYRAGAAAGSTDKTLHAAADCRILALANAVHEKREFMFPNAEYCSVCWEHCRECDKPIKTGYLCTECDTVEIVD